MADVGFPISVELGAAAGVEAAGGDDGASADFSVSELDEELDVEGPVDNVEVAAVITLMVVGISANVATLLLVESSVLVATLPDGVPVSKSL
jgi:hypothetical protein